jgi:hypothetical protein
VQKDKRVKILPFAKSGKIFAIRDVWIQIAKVLAKAHLNPFSSSPIPFPAISYRVHKIDLLTTDGHGHEGGKEEN